MPIPSSPPPAAVTPGNLYADAGPRTLWLGVDPAVDPAGAVLVSDIVGILQEIAASLVTAAAYADSQVATRAPTVHTHTAAAVTDFTAAVLAVLAGVPGAAIPPGFIGLWSGSVVDIGVGALAGWALCDGTNGTPNLKDRFVMGAGNVAAGSLNPAATASTSLDGAHTPIILGTALSTAQLPPHTHTVNLSGSDTATTSLDGDHNHGTAGATPYVSGAALLADATARSITSSTRVTTVSGNHTHSVTVTVNINGNTGSLGTGAAHAHTADPVPAHLHSITSAALRAALPYYALAYIMKL